IRAALAQAGVAPAAIGYVEAHGTGTALGDPIEMQALAAALADGRGADQPLWVGSVKTNLGHLEAAAGMAGLIKTVLALQHQTLPAHLHFETPNANIPWADIAIAIPTQTTPWPASPGARLAGVSAFGFSGTNAHVVLAGPPAPTPAVASSADQSPYLLPVSAHTPAALRAQAERYAALLNAPAVPALADLAAAAGVGRTHFAQRAAIVAAHAAEAGAALTALAEGRPHTVLHSGQILPGHPVPRVVFICAGQGGQWAGLAPALLADPLAVTTLQQAAQVAPPDLGWSLLDVLADPAAAWLERIDQLQPILFALQIALAARLKAWGVTPAAVVGHSFGEVAAAYLAGALTLPEALRVICARSQALAQRRGQGTMAVVELSPDAAPAALHRWSGAVTVAGVNGPRSLILTGGPSALADLIQAFAAQGIFARLLAVDVAAHSPQLDPLLSALETQLAGLQPQAGALPFYSTVTGQLAAGAELNAAYWARNLRAPVQFWPALQALATAGYTHFVELSPHPTHLTAVADGLRALAVDGVALPTLRRDRPTRETLLTTLSALYCAGVTVDWTEIAPQRRAVTVLPTYPFQRERFWIDLPAGNLAPSRERPPARGRRSLASLGQPVELSLPGDLHVWQQDLAPDTFDYLAHHTLDGTVVLPATTYIDWMLAAARAALGPQAPDCLEEVRFEQLLALAPAGARRVQVVLQSAPPGSAAVRVYSRLFNTDEPRSAHAPWTLHAAATIRPATAPAEAPNLPNAALADILARCPHQLTGADFYARLADQGLQYGPPFQGLTEIHHHQAEALARLAPPPAALEDGQVIHPAFLDACFQLLGATVPLAADDLAPYLPVGLGQLRLMGRLGAARWVHVRRLAAADAQEIHGDLTVSDTAGQPLLIATGLRARRVALQRRAANTDPNHLFYAVQWQPAALNPAPAAPAASWLILADRAGHGAALRAALEAGGQRCVTVLAGEAYASPSPDVYQLDPEDPAAFKRLLREALAGRPPCRGVVHLWGLDAPVAPEAERGAACVSALHLVQALAHAGWRDAPRLWLVTRGAQAVGPEPRRLAVTQAALWGFGRTVSLEHPALRCALVDLDPAGGGDQPDAQLAALCLADGSEDAVAWRAGQAYVPRLARVPQPAALPSLRADGTYLLTGGLGGLGLAVARWLIAQGARSLALVGRHDPAEAAQPLLSELRGAGATVVTIRADVAQRAEVIRLLEQLDRELPPLCGVLHAAGILDDGVITQLTAPRLRAVSAPKLAGAWHLHELTRDRPLDCFVLFSSVAALLGSPGQANYAAANAGLDALAHHRRALGLPALSLNWGPWSEVGLAAAQVNRGQRLALQGINSLTRARGLQALGLLLSQPAPQVAVVHLNLRQWREFHLAAADAPLLTDLVRAEENASPRPADDPGLLAALQAAEPARRPALLAAHIREQFAQVMRLDPAALDPLIPFGSLGLDSLMGLEIRNRLERSLGLTLSAALVWTYPTLAALTTFLAEALELPAEPSLVPNPGAAPSRPAAAEARAGVAELSDEEAERLLLQELDKLTDHGHEAAP
ncbi:MAG: type I polyketide synthase, partial [Anaerolineales bacterium]|nr:type I polyketide synthase [Anaerolineales bacterium]